MKKFSNVDEKNKVLTEQKPKINKLVDFLIKENLQVTYDGDVDEAITKKLTISGSDELVEKLNLLIEKSKIETETYLSETLKYRFGNQYDQKTLNEEIKLENSKIYSDIISLPQDIFSSEDYEQIQEDTIVLKSLNNIPTDYMDFINLKNATKYFENENNITLKFSNNWELNFKDNGSYGTPIDSQKDKYAKFISENNEFIADFLRATTELIGSKNVLLNKNLINI